MSKKQYKERRIYFAGQCTNCEHPFQSFKRSRIKAGLCKKCRKLVPPKGQDSLFGAVAGVKELGKVHVGFKAIPFGLYQIGSKGEIISPGGVLVNQAKEVMKSNVGS
jgi:hypothetical protein